MFRTKLAVTCVAVAACLSASSADAACEPAGSQACRNMEEAMRTGERLQKEREARESRRIIEQSGTSQYTGPTFRIDPSKGEIGGGYQWSTK
jgi:Ni/Co efflux regulator RcnB